MANQLTGFYMVQIFTESISGEIDRRYNYISLMNY